jgi:hypothetical protein
MSGPAAGKQTIDSVIGQTLDEAVRQLGFESRLPCRLMRSGPARVMGMVSIAGHGEAVVIRDIQHLCHSPAMPTKWCAQEASGNAGLTVPTAHLCRSKTPRARGSTFVTPTNAAVAAGGAQLTRPRLLVPTRRGPWCSSAGSRSGRAEYSRSPKPYRSGSVRRQSPVSCATGR